VRRQADKIDETKEYLPKVPLSVNDMDAEAVLKLLKKTVGK
jgi:hypothetical protein